MVYSLPSNIASFPQSEHSKCSIVPSFSHIGATSSTFIQVCESSPPPDDELSAEFLQPTKQQVATINIAKISENKIFFILFFIFPSRFCADYSARTLGTGQASISKVQNDLSHFLSNVVSFSPSSPVVRAVI